MNLLQVQKQDKCAVIFVDAFSSNVQHALIGGMQYKPSLMWNVV